MAFVSQGRLLITGTWAAPGDNQADESSIGGSCDQRTRPSKRVNTWPRAVTFRLRDSYFPFSADLPEDLFVDTRFGALPKFQDHSLDGAAGVICVTGV